MNWNRMDRKVCSMTVRSFGLMMVMVLTPAIAQAQAFVKTADLFTRHDVYGQEGYLKIMQDPAIDTLISRYLMVNKNIYDEYGHFGMEGWRIQIFNSSKRNAREESNKTRALFISKFPDIASYPLYAEPGYFKIRVGDFRTKTEAARLFMLVSREFPNAYLVPDIINFPDLNKK